ncbi:glycoside hydrolase family 95 protein [Prolixibacteraceae bacterium JC049]|nr:glycoside hydrolase family 95 protein [Prolixibacteraceae bacterium JC049]
MMKFYICVLGLLMSFVLNAQENKLWYKQPAKQWNEALPVGNGRLGAMVFGGVAHERIQLNEESVWTKGIPYEDKTDGHKYVAKIQQLLFDGEYAAAEKMCKEKLLSGRNPESSTYQTLGDLDIYFEGVDKHSDYRRELNLDSACVTSQFKVNGVKHKRTIFSSAPSQAIVFKAEADKKGQINCRMRFSRRGDGEIVEAIDDILVMKQHINNGRGVKFETRLKLKHKGGTLSIHNNELVVKNADIVEFRLVAATNYSKGDPTEKCLDYLNLNADKTYNQLLQRHYDDYQSFYNRVQLQFNNTSASKLPTDIRLKKQKAGENDPSLAELYFNYGRYLLISSSRPGCLPANLQGIWCDELKPAWFSDYHININAQMNYWPAEITNLSELHVPFLKYIDRLRERGRKTAKAVYGVNGFVAHHRSDVWHFTTPYGAPQYGMWPMGAAWAATHMWDHFVFGKDKQFLKETGYPVMKEAALFLSELMVRNPKSGKWTIGPSASPENVYVSAKGEKGSVVMGAAMDLQIIRHLFNCCIAAAETLQMDADFKKQLEEQLKELTPIKIGADGRILEWSDESLTEASPGHRHISHLYGLFPAGLYNWNSTPEYMKAAQKVIEGRLKNGGGHTGWSRAWMINFYARLLDSQKAWENLVALWTKSTLPNLFDNHPPFQIDGNFGGTAAIAEMLVQSYAGEIHLLPCLPKQLANGKVKGLVVQGGHTLEMVWKNGKVTSATIIAKSKETIPIRMNGVVQKVTLKKGRNVVK